MSLKLKQLKDMPMLKSKTFICYFCKKTHPTIRAHGIATQDRKLIDVCDECFENEPTAHKIVTSKYELRDLSDWMLIEE